MKDNKVEEVEEVKRKNVNISCELTADLSYVEDS
jgi:hypothetical protein